MGSWNRFPDLRGALQDGGSEHHFFCLGNRDTHSVWRAHPTVCAVRRKLCNNLLGTELLSVPRDHQKFWAHFLCKLQLFFFFFFMRPSSWNSDLPRTSQLVPVCILSSLFSCLPAFNLILTLHMLKIHLRAWRVCFEVLFLTWVLPAHSQFTPESTSLRNVFCNTLSSTSPLSPEESRRVIESPGQFGEWHLYWNHLGEYGWRAGRILSLLLSNSNNWWSLVAQCGTRKKNLKKKRRSSWQFLKGKNSGKAQRWDCMEMGWFPHPSRKSRMLESVKITNPKSPDNPQLFIS